MITGQMSGYVWSANCGWISLSNAVAYVQTDTIQPGALAPDGLPIAWLLTYFGTTNVNANADPDRQRHDHRAGLPCRHRSEQRQQYSSYHRREFFVRRNQRHAHLEQRANALLLHLNNAQSGTQLDGQRLGTHFALRRFHHDSRFHRRQCADAILSRSRRFVRSCLSLEDQGNHVWSLEEIVGLLP